MIIIHGVSNQVKMARRKNCLLYRGGGNNIEKLNSSTSCANRLNLILTALNAATQAAQMGIPGMRFHPLHGNRYSVWVDENYRVTFRFDGGHAYKVDYEDYH